MVLYSRKTATPLAALTLKAGTGSSNKSCCHMLTARPSLHEPVPFFQGMLNLPDQPFSFVLSNLSEKSYIHFSIGHLPDPKVVGDQPGGSQQLQPVNRINVLHVNQSYEIVADWSSGNRKMILSGKNNTFVDPTTEVAKQVKVTVDEAEKNGTPMGVYFHLSVFPERSTELAAKFAEGTVWRVVPGFVRKVAKPVVVSSHPIRYFSPSLDDGFRSGSRDGAAPFAAFGGGSHSHGSSGLFGRREGAGRDGAAPSAGFGGGSLGSSGLFGGREGAAPVPRHGGDSDSSDDEDECEEEDCCELPQSNCFAASVDVGATQAGKLSHGSVVHEQVASTNRMFDVSKSSEPAVLSMSIWEDMKFLPLPDIKHQLQAVAHDWIKNENKALVESLNGVFKSDTCVIDLESEADTIICSCGHQCIHHSNMSVALVACPMCRAPISAFLRAEDNFGYVGV